MCSLAIDRLRCTLQHMATIYRYIESSHSWDLDEAYWKQTKREPEFSTHFRPIVQHFVAKTTTNRDWSFRPPLCVRPTPALSLSLSLIQSASCSPRTLTSCSCVCLWVCLAVCSIYAKVCVCVSVCVGFFSRACLSGFCVVRARRARPRWFTCCWRRRCRRCCCCCYNVAACTHCCCCCCCYLESRIVAARRRRRRRYELWGLSFWVECTPERCLNAASSVAHLPPLEAAVLAHFAESCLDTAHTLKHT